MKKKHASEPWEVGHGPWNEEKGAYETVITAECRDVATLESAQPTRPTLANMENYYEDAETNADRIVACINACTGFANPGAIPALVEAMKELVCCPAFNSKVFEGDRESHKAWTLAREALREIAGEIKT